MRYNPHTFRWEGNESEYLPFDEGSGGLPTNLPRPALIASIKSAKNVQVVGKMVFDPTRMCWLKVDNTASDEEDDVFKEIDDLDDGTSATPESTIYSGPSEKFQDLILPKSSTSVLPLCNVNMKKRTGGRLKFKDGSLLLKLLAVYVLGT